MSTTKDFNDIQDKLVCQIEQNLKISLKEEDYDKNLFGEPYMIYPRDMLYVLIKFEEYLGYKITDIFKTHSSDIMTIRNLADAISKLGQ